MEFWCSGPVPGLHLCICFISAEANDVRKLGKTFKKLDLDKSGSLSVDEFMSLPELQHNPLVQRVVEIFDTDGDGEVNFMGKILVQEIQQNLQILI